MLIYFTGFASTVSAHEVRPAYLDVREITSTTYDFLWKTPAQGDMRLNLNVILPHECHITGMVRTTKVKGAAVQTWRSQCDGGLLGKTIYIENLEASLTDALLQYEPLVGEGLTLRILGSAPYAHIPIKRHGWIAAKTYLGFGVTHILAGIDHLLFVFCLILIIKSRRQLLGAITAFTIAHSITLIGTTLGWVHLPTAPVEASIALSIAFLAAEVIQAQKGKVGTIHRWPWLAAFGFGLLHGFGFATALNDIGIGEDSIPISLFFFNVGIELGQLLFVICILMICKIGKKYFANNSLISMRYVPLSVGVLSSYWFIERTMDIF
ncbi:HupE/UreJ family protein [Neptunicella sp.]|uniref:HupE/UreJ family protein n=1 Tax=Neptunicella sp. TaxID=2125986 RepID=UPI003F69157E